MRFDKEVVQLHHAILIACEESQIECVAFRKSGYIAFSCDLQNCSGGHPEWHIVGDVVPLLTGCKVFKTESGSYYQVDRWSMVIAHPPCTYLSAAANVYMFDCPGTVRIERYIKGQYAASLFRLCLATDAEYICVENPRPWRMWGFPPPSQRLSPEEFGHHWSKRTYFWLKNLPPLLPSLFVSDTRSWVFTKKGQKMRSKSFEGIAKAMVEQWGSYVQECLIDRDAI